MPQIPGPKSLELAKRLKAVENPTVTFVDTKFPVFWKRGFGSQIEDVDGNIFTDLTAAFGVAALGHANEVVIESMISQLRTLPHGMGDVHPPGVKVELLELLASLFPEPGAQTLLCSSGAEAVEVALKTAFLKTNKPCVLYFEGGYHGLTYGTLAVSGGEKFRAPFERQLAPLGWKHKFPNTETDVTVSISSISELIQQSQLTRNPIGAILLEPFQGRAGVRIPPKGWLKQISELCKKWDVLLIADEIFTGFGRTGSMFATDHEGVIPDLLCVGKALTGTLPFSACIGRKEVMRAWPESTGEALHTSTFLGHPLGCAAAMASIREIQKQQLPKRARELGQKVMEQLTGWKKFSIVHDVRGKGLMIGVELKRKEETGLAFEVAKLALQEGVLLLPSGSGGNVISISPPLNIPENLFLEALEKVGKILETRF